jgi:hypothetical protein
MEADNRRIKLAAIEIEFLEPVDSKKYKDATALSNKAVLKLKTILSN